MKPTNTYNTRFSQHKQAEACKEATRQPPQPQAPPQPITTQPPPSSHARLVALYDALHQQRGLAHENTHSTGLYVDRNHITTRSLYGSPAHTSMFSSSNIIPPFYRSILTEESTQLLYHLAKDTSNPTKLHHTQRHPGPMRSTYAQQYAPAEQQHLQPPAHACKPLIRDTFVRRNDVGLHLRWGSST